MFRFTIREALWAMVVAGLVLALFVEWRRYGDLSEAAGHLENAFEGLCEFAAEEEDWTIVVATDQIDVSRPGRQNPKHPGMPNMRLSWERPGRGWRQLQLNKTWSRATLRAEEQAIWGPDETPATDNDP